ncbi:MAG TPA: amidohydrolase family protein [Candidatus Acidoferrales bacterium]
MSYRVIDLHVHVQPLEMFKPEALELIRRGRKDFDQLVEWFRSPAKFVALLDSIEVERAALINYVSPDVIGFTPEVNDWVAKYAAPFPKRLIAVGSVHPRYVSDAAGEVDRLVTLGIRMLKVHPPHQLLYPNEYRQGLGTQAAIYERAQHHNLPVMFHTGTSVFPGARNIYADPLFVDDVAVDFPRLRIILAHGGRPLWMNNAFFIVRRHPNVWMDISSIPPHRLLEYFPRLEEIARKVLYGSDWPGPSVASMPANMDAICRLNLSDKAKSMIFYDNAAALFPL